MMYVTCIVQDKATSVTNMDTVTTSIGRVALRNPFMVANLWRPTLEDIILTTLREERQVSTFKQSNYGSPHQSNFKLC